MSENWWDKLSGGFRDRYGEGREDTTRSYYLGRERQGLDPESTRGQSTIGTNPLINTIRDLTGTSNPEQVRARKDMGMGLSDDPVRRSGQVLGTVANDLTQDHTRSIWWLLNAAQATGNVINEEVLAKVNPDFFKKQDTGMEMPQMEEDANGVMRPKRYRSEAQTRVNRKKYDDAVAADLISGEGVRRKGVSVDKGRLMQRKINPGDFMALGIAPGIAINAGMGLMTPFGGYEGYEAAIPDADDPSKTANPILEVGAKYILGRTGNLLNWDEFSEVRPDVSKGEYNAYKAFKYDKNIDLNPFDDGQMTLPMGVLKTTADGIHGAEVQFLGRSLPVNTALIPYASAVIGGALGARRRGGANMHPVRNGLIGGFGGLTAGTVVGNLLEQERRRRNTAANEIDPENSLVTPQ